MGLVMPQLPVLAQQYARINSLQNLDHNPLADTPVGLLNMQKE